MKLWISRNEILRPDRDGISTALQAEGIPKEWIKLPDKNQWLAAKKAAKNLGLADFDGGLGEFLVDGTVIGAATGFQESEDKGVADQALSIEVRRAKTRIQTEAAKPETHLGLRGAMASPAPPAKYESETNFATRIVIVAGP